MRILRPRTIGIFRARQTAVVGRLPYGAMRKEEEDPVMVGLKAQISATRESRPITAGLPSGTLFRSLYKIIFRGPVGVVRSKDVLRDDLGNRYQVMSAQYGRLGCDVLAELMEV